MRADVHGRAEWQAHTGGHPGQQSGGHSLNASHESAEGVMYYRTRRLLLIVSQFAMKDGTREFRCRPFGRILSALRWGLGTQRVEKRRRVGRDRPARRSSHEFLPRMLLVAEDSH